MNPVTVKGVERALDLAEQNPSLPFQFVDCWNNEPEKFSQRKNRAVASKNINWIPYTTNMPRDVYSKTQILLAPSTWDEGYTRVVAEAQSLAIPVLASDKGGLVEAVGPGGINLGNEQSLKVWSDALNLLWGNRAVYRAYSTLALQHAHRAEIQPAAVVDIFQEQLLNFLNGLSRTSIPKSTALG